MSEYIIEYLPDTTSIEREEIVRCRDCKHFKEFEALKVEGFKCSRVSTPFEVEPDGFCAWGERRG